MLMKAQKGHQWESQFLGSTLCRPIQLSERAAQLKLARNVHGKRRSKKNLKSRYEVLTPGSTIIKVSLTTTSMINETEKAIVTVRNIDIAENGAQYKRQKPLKEYATRRGPPPSEKLVEEKMQRHIKEFNRK